MGPREGRDIDRVGKALSECGGRQSTYHVVSRRTSVGEILLFFTLHLLSILIPNGGSEALATFKDIICFLLHYFFLYRRDQVFVIYGCQVVTFHIAV